MMAVSLTVDLRDVVQHAASPAVTGPDTAVALPVEFSSYAFMRSHIVLQVDRQSREERSA